MQGYNRKTENKYSQNRTRKQQNGRHGGISAAILEFLRRVIENLSIENIGLSHYLFFKY